MKPFYRLDCPSQTIIATQTLTYILENTNLYENSTQFWNKIDTMDFLKQSPALVEYCRSLNLLIREVAILVAKDHSGLNIHIDEAPLVAKINFPILNTKNTFTEWYDIPEEKLAQTPIVKNQFGNDVYDLDQFNDVSKLTKLGEIEMDCPIVFNSAIPHLVRMGEQADLPRIVLACMFFNQPIDYLR